jgi:serine-type D-Ala-D-Ala carboxypeptidase
MPVDTTRALDVLRRGIDDDAMPGSVVCALRHGKPILHEALGTLDGTRPTALDTIYDLASVTKPMATASSVLTLVERGELALNAPLPSLLGDAAAHLANVTILHLLTHTSGLPSWCGCFERGRGLDCAVETILRRPAAPAGSKYEYSCLGFILLGRIVELVSGQPLDAFARQHLFDKLGLREATYNPPASKRDRIAPTKSKEKAQPDDAPDRALVGVVHDGNARAIGGVAGNAGLFATAHDVATFGQSLLSGLAASAASCSRDDVPRLFGAPATARIFDNQVKSDIGAHTFLFFAQGNPLCPAGDLFSPRAVGHSGYTGNMLLIDPAYDLVVALLSNRVYTDPDGGKWLGVRRRFTNALAASIV